MKYVCVGQGNKPIYVYGPEGKEIVYLYENECNGIGFEKDSDGRFSVLSEERLSDIILKITEDQVPAKAVKSWMADQLKRAAVTASSQEGRTSEVLNRLINAVIRSTVAV